jgi:hypothetical protein
MDCNSHYVALRYDNFTLEIESLGIGCELLMERPRKIPAHNCEGPAVSTGSNPSIGSCGNNPEKCIEFAIADLSSSLTACLASHAS